MHLHPSKYVWPSALPCCYISPFSSSTRALDPLTSFAEMSHFAAMSAITASFLPCSAARWSAVLPCSQWQQHLFYLFSSFESTDIIHYQPIIWTQTPIKSQSIHETAEHIGVILPIQHSVGPQTQWCHHTYQLRNTHLLWRWDAGMSHHGAE